MRSKPPVLVLSITLLLAAGFASAQQLHPWNEITLPAGVWPGLNASDSQALQGFVPADFFAADLWLSSGNDIYNLNSGNVGIGGLPTGTQKLQVAGDINASKLVDRENAAYYLDPSGTSVFNTINLGGVPRSDWPQETVDTTCEQSGLCTQVCIGTNCIDSSRLSDWDAAHSWGDHASAGYLTSESDSSVPSYVKAITSTQITNWDTAYSWGNHPWSKSGSIYTLSGSAVITDDVTVGGVINSQNGNVVIELG